MGEGHNFRDTAYASTPASAGTTDPFGTLRQTSLPTEERGSDHGLGPDVASGPAAASGPEGGAVPAAATDLTAELVLDASGGHLLEGLRAASALRKLADRLESAQVVRARAYGWSWQDIAEALGVTRQAAHQKYGRPEKLRAAAKRERSEHEAEVRATATVRAYVATRKDRDNRDNRDNPANSDDRVDRHHPEHP